MTDKTPGADNPVFVDPESGFEIRPIDKGRDADLATILADGTGAGTAEAAQAKIDEARNEAPDRVFGGLMNDDLVGAYTLRREGMANAIGIIAVAKDHRKRGFGRSMLMDALRRSGRRPLVAETDEDGLGFYKACGFKMIGRRKQPDGTFRYRVGWHAPGTGSRGSAATVLAQKGIIESC